MRLRIEKAIYGGAGLSRIGEGPLAGKAVFVPMALPGETVEAHIVEDRGSFANAELDAVLEAARSRIAAACPYYGVCGGCHYQHAEYPQQLEMKAAVLRESLERAGVLPPAIAVLSGGPWGYRNRIRLHVRPGAHDGPPALCYRQRGSHTMLAVGECPIAAPVLVRSLQAIQQLAGPLRIDQLCDEIELFTNDSQAAVLLSLSGRPSGDKPQAQLHNLCAALNSEVPEVHGAALFRSVDGLEAINSAAKSKGGKNKSAPSPTRAALANWGEQALTYTAAGFDYRVSLGSFFQVNRFLVDGLVDLVTRTYSGDLAWDLYAGVGLFARALTSRFRLVRGVESAPSSCADLRENLGGTAHKVVESSTLDFLRLQAASPSKAKKQTRPDLVVVDPPRAGLGGEVTALLARIAPREIVYVSCDPATLARDLRALLQSGYRIDSTTLVDLFPQTFHLESVSHLSLR